MIITECNPEYKKAFEDMLMYGTGTIIIQQDKFKHLPFEGTNDNQIPKDNPTPQNDFTGLSNPCI
jgi:hypothetical protein